MLVRLGASEQEIRYKVESHGIKGSFWVPGKDESMRIMFHSCNGFSVKIPKDAYAGPALWNDVLRTHDEKPFHVMIGGGDQIYSDMICQDGPLKEWAHNLSPSRRARTPFTEQTAKKLDEWYFNNYVDWFTVDPFRKALATVPSMNIWDDHDIIDGYGSYRDHLLRTPIFIGIGKTAHKYYMLFQHHTSPSEIENNPDPSFVVGVRPGPYINQKSVSLCSNLGPRTVFYGLECRVERTRNRICYESTYDSMFTRLDQAVEKGKTKHLVILLGVPIAYPRLVWLEGLLGSKIVTTPIKLLGKLFGLGSGFFNNFDGSSELLDDLDDHWCAVHHKHERNTFIWRLQDFAHQKAVRITILSGDVHLAAVGRFFSNPRLRIPQDKDQRYMVNIISSAITNAPPPKAIANLMHRRNKLHHLDKHTQENLMHLFREYPDGQKRTCSSTMPARNYAIITEHAGLTARGEIVEHVAQGADIGNTHVDSAATINRNGTQRTGKKLKEAVTHAQQNMGLAKEERGETPTEEMSARGPVKRTMRPFTLDVAFRVEIDPLDPEGKTKAYGLTIPALEMDS
ncbi:hypothetical protein M422DRAFT_243256 [Sphaerobolus stellatus SS14]|nr:hypothetical protein M422DRAFT_243256 [Sphaerobolus stellatus SS14]